jgi:hypothetical protein
MQPESPEHSVRSSIFDVGCGDRVRLCSLRLAKKNLWVLGPLEKTYVLGFFPCQKRDGAGRTNSRLPAGGVSMEVI